MQVILLENIKNLGKIGDIIKVKKGYARNFLIPLGKAAYATEESKAEFETKRDLIEKSELGKLNKARDIAEKISNLEVELKVAVSEEQSMYGSIGTKEISEQLVSLGYEISPQFIRLIHGSFKAPDLFVSAIGTTRFGAANLTLIAFPKRIFFRDRREILMPHLVNSFKVSDEAQVNRRHLLIAICLALIVGSITSFYSYLKLAYTKGAITLSRSWIHTISPQEPFRELERFLVNPQSTNWQQMAFVGSGALVMFCLLSMQYRFMWWPLHPIGFITPGQFPMNNIWFSIFWGWLFKSLVVRYSGLKGYRRAKPIFLGVVLGEAFIAGVWAIVGLFSGKGYNFLYF